MKKKNRFREYYRKHRKEYAAYQRKWRKEHPEKVKEYQIRYWERKLKKIKGGNNDDDSRND